MPEVNSFINLVICSSRGVTWDDQDVFRVWVSPVPKEKERNSYSSDIKRIQSKLVFFTGSIQLPARIWSCNVRLHSKPRADKHCSELSYLCGMWGKGSCDKSLLPFCHSSLKRADASGIRSFLTFPFLMQENGLSSSWASSWLTLQEYCDVSSAAPVYSSKAAAPLAASL